MKQLPFFENSPSHRHANDSQNRQPDPSLVERLREEIRQQENRHGGMQRRHHYQQPQEQPHELSPADQQIVHQASHVYSTGCTSWDQRLPAGGIRKGSLVEWLATETGSGAPLLSLAAARAALGKRWLVVVDRSRQFYPHAAANLGIDLERTIVVRPGSPKEELWAIDQALRCRGVGVVWAPLANLDWRSFRRLQLAAEQGETLGMLLRPERVRGLPSWSHLGFHVQSLVSEGDRRWQVELLHWRGQWTQQNHPQQNQHDARCWQQAIYLELDEVTGALRDVPQETSIQTFNQEVREAETAMRAIHHEQASRTIPLPLAAALAPATTSRRQA